MARREAHVVAELVIHAGGIGVEAGTALGGREDGRVDASGDRDRLVRCAELVEDAQAEGLTLRTGGLDGGAGRPGP